MSARKVQAADTVAKVDNAAKPATASLPEKPDVLTACENVSDETEAAVSKETPSKETPTFKPDTKSSSNAESKRITRNSPLTLLSPTPPPLTPIKKDPHVESGGETEQHNSEDSGSATAVRKTPTNIRGRKSIKESKDTAKETKEPNETTKEPVQIAKETKENTHELPSNNSSSSENQGTSVTSENKDLKEHELKDVKESKENEIKEPLKENPKETDSAKETAHPLPRASTASTNSSLDTSASSTASKITKVLQNRMTRKSLAEELAAQKRITRQKNAGRSETPRSETPPTGSTRRSRRPAVSAAKRKRSTDKSPQSAASKLVKVESKDEKAGSRDEKAGSKDETPESAECVKLPTAGTPSASTDTDEVKIKQEPIESDDSMLDTASSSNSLNVPAATAGRPRGRLTIRKNLPVSPSTRATRHNKVMSPSPSPSRSITLPKRRRTGSSSTTNSVTRSNSLSLLKTVTTAGSQLPDEDSKDSLFSMDELLLNEIKLETLTPELEELDSEMDDKLSTTTTDGKSEASAPNGIVEPLTVDTEPSPSTPNATPLGITSSPRQTSTEAAAPISNRSTGDSEKSASLSPDMVSEGLSEISVKQFYKKAEFLENNRGIEEDPKLGEIVQKVATEKDDVHHAAEPSKDAVSTEPKTGIAPELKKTPEQEVNREVEENPVKSEENAEFKEEASENKDDGDEEDKLNDSFCESIKEGELRFEESSDERKSNFDDGASRSTLNISPVQLDDEQDTEIVESEATATDKIIIDEDDLEDDITVEESESVSMDNNPSLHDDIPEDREEIDEVEDLEHDLDTGNQTDEKTNEIECDSNEAKLNVETLQIINELEQSLEKDEDEIQVQTEEKEKPDAVTVDIKIDAGSESELMPDCIDDILLEDLKTELELELDTKEEESIVTKIDAATREEDSRVTKIDTELQQDDENKLESDCAKKAENKENMTAEDLVTVAPKFEAGATEANETKSVPVIEISMDEEKVEIAKSAVDGQLKLVKESEPIKDQKKEKEGMVKEEIIASDSQIPAKSDYLTSSNVSNASSKANSVKDDDNTSVKSSQSTDAGDCVIEHEEKGKFLISVGLVTHQVAQKQREENIQSSAAAEVTRSTQQQSTKRNGKATTSAASQEYTGTLKTVIKLNRTASGPSTSNGRKGHGASQHASKDTNGGTQRRQSLKMTFQKGRGRGQANSDRTTDQQTHGEDAYYTIQNESEGAPKAAGNASAEQPNVHSHGRKPYNRSNNTSHSTSTTNSATIEAAHADGLDSHGTTANKKDEREKILIPEKASSFKFHPGRLCEDQCYYCSGKFGLYDTPCHVGQIKSVERQNKILANEEKLTVDNCLCDACFRHVDRRANVPSYNKRLSATSSDKPGAAQEERGRGRPGSARKCVMPDCNAPAAHSIRRRCIRKSVKKLLYNLTTPTTSAYIWLCQSHYATVIQCSDCVLCKRRLGRNHIYHITTDIERLEACLHEMEIPVRLNLGTAVCKLCRYFANLLMKPPENSKSQKADFVRSYKKKLLRFYNVHDSSHEVSEAEDEENAAPVRKPKGRPAAVNKREKKQRTSRATSSKEKSSPTRSSASSSVECLHETALETAGANASGSENQQLQDSDVMPDYEMPAGSTDSNASSSPPPSSEPKQMSKLKAILQSRSPGAKSAKSAPSSDISNVLRANPNISMRELFPGEEDLGLNFKAPFGSAGSQRTPEGWTRVNTFLQYDEPTRRLWEELQKPYGNQSSFLRHLILLEKYYRNGDLVLSPNASSNATVYTQTVRQRLTSYDHGHCGGLQADGSSPAAATEKPAEEIPTVEVRDDDDDDVQMVETDKKASESPAKPLRPRSASVDKLTKQLSSQAVTITARPKEAPKQPATKPSAAEPPKSLPKEKEVDSATPSTVPTTAAPTTAASTSSAASSSRSILKSNLLGINKSVEILSVPSSPAKGAGNTNATTETKQQKILEVANKLLGNQMEAQAAASKSAASNALLNSPPELISLQRRLSGGNAPPIAIPNPLAPAKRLPTAAKPNSSRNGPPNVVILPETLTTQERLQSKSWRPTLMPVEENQHLLNKSSALYQTADGRRLPALVQVQSGGKPFLISIFDYNRMCILRREKLLRDQMLKSTKNRNDPKMQQMQQHQQQQQQQQHHQQQQQHHQQQQQHHQQQQQQQQQQQMQKNAAANQASLQNFTKNLSKAQQVTAQQQLLQLQYLSMHKQHQQQQQAAMKAAASRFQSIAPKPAVSASATATSSAAAANVSANSFNSTMMPILANAMGAGSNAPSSWLWNNFPDANQLLMNGNQTPKLPQLLPKPTTTGSNNTPGTLTAKQQQQLMLDNALMSKIPKSLTVIPQHKLMNASNASSGSASSGANMRE